MIFKTSEPKSQHTDDDEDTFIRDIGPGQTGFPHDEDWNTNLIWGLYGATTASSCFTLHFNRSDETYEMNEL